MRRASRVVVGSPTVRMAALLAATVLVALLGVGALVVGAQSPSPVAPDGRSPQPPVAFTGRFECGPEVRSGTSARTAFEVDEGNVSALQERGHAWEQIVETSDPRFSGVKYYSSAWDTFTWTGSGGFAQWGVGRVTDRIQNDGGAWQGTMVEVVRPDEVDSPVNQTYVLVGEGGYEGLTAVYEIVDQPSDCVFDIEGLIFEGETPAAEPFIPE